MNKLKRYIAQREIDEATKCVRRAIESAQQAGLPGDTIRQMKAIWADLLWTHEQLQKTTPDSRPGSPMPSQSEN